MVIARAGRLAIEVLVKPAVFGSHGWRTAEDPSHRTAGELSFLGWLLKSRR
jgi:hypothetical protein